uniref:Uncharacterized protein n=1 Tax=Ditylenchus dipsaci TaxID=166011 RepID=A0A915DP98_9BILA
MQSKMQCCGVDNYTDWFYSLQWPNHRFVPDSCCDASLFNDAKNSMLNCGKVKSIRNRSTSKGAMSHSQTTFYTFQLSFPQLSFEQLSLSNCRLSNYRLSNCRLSNCRLSNCHAATKVIVLISSGRLLYHFHKRDQRYSGRNKNEASYSYTSAGEDGGKCDLMLRDET